jgi:hypothetical protein
MFGSRRLADVRTLSAGTSNAWGAGRADFAWATRKTTRTSSDAVTVFSSMSRLTCRSVRTGAPEGPEPCE